MHRISCSVVMYICMYVCMYMSRLGMQFKRQADYPACIDCGPFVIHLAYYSDMDNEDDKERSGHLVTLDTHRRLPTSDLAVETMIFALLETAVTTQCTLAFGEGPDS